MAQKRKRRKKEKRKKVKKKKVKRKKKKGKLKIEKNNNRVAVFCAQRRLPFAHMSNWHLGTLCDAKMVWTDSQFASIQGEERQPLCKRKLLPDWSCVLGDIYTKEKKGRMRRSMYANVSLLKHEKIYGNAVNTVRSEYLPKKTDGAEEEKKEKRKKEKGKKKKSKKKKEKRKIEN
ncbi:hypothetical protein POVCU2_0097780 [Plasmodium ovale curtisi]|uniref:Uncharacterized protein n=1 Tax=Plasmodium ovale curtisi TaxID=864141 RepID=A0A1A8WUY5_PLAOA|nr:hypothetical protein POVCU2_0097780 [Plasmodium ovale curtisi]